ncbi:MAG: aminotransferase class IV [Bacteroidetes bacterium]|nr:aminotransferase class IV [Bacteroidota bacterium]
MDSNFTFFNGEYIPFNQSSVPVSDLIIQRGYGIFDFFLVRELVPRFLSFHLDRFLKSAALMDLELAYTKEELADIVQNLIRKNNIPNSSVKIMLTGGVSMDDFTLDRAKSTLIIINKPFELKLPNAWKNGASLITSHYQRELPEAKTINYIRSVRLSQKLIETNAAEILYFDRNWVRECSRSNVFYVKDNCVYTPKSKILEGVTRKRILQLKGYPIQAKDFKIKDLLAADEVFITSTTKGVLPIIKVDSQIIGDGRIGVVTKAIQKAIMAE